MATIRKEIRIEARPETVWDALRDVGALHTRLAPGFVTAVRMEEGARVVTFGNGLVAREVIVSVEDDARRLVWTVAGGRMTHHNGAAQVIAEGPEQSRFVWTSDLLPVAVAPAIEAMMTQAMPIIKATVERAARQERPPRPPDVAPREFDFWLGSWKVADRETGKELGVSRVDSAGTRAGSRTPVRCCCSTADSMTAPWTCGASRPTVRTSASAGGRRTAAACCSSGSRRPTARPGSVASKACTGPRSPRPLA